MEFTIGFYLNNKHHKYFVERSHCSTAPIPQNPHDKRLKFYLSRKKDGNNYLMSSALPSKNGYHEQIVDLADRHTTNNDYYPDPIIKEELYRENGLFFITPPFEQDMSVNGFFSGNLIASINKRDMDIGVVLYELTPEGKYFQLFVQE